MIALWLLACAGPVEPGPIAVPDGIEASAPVTCGDPDQGFDRFDERGAGSGLDWRWQPDALFDNEVAPGGHLVVHDLDADGDDDVAFANPRGWPAVYRNDGTAHFEAVTLGADWVEAYEEHVSAMAVADLDGDRLPEWFFATPGALWVSRNLGSLSWAEPELIYDEGEGLPLSAFLTLALGDIDGDGDLDVVLPGAERLTGIGQEPFFASTWLTGTWDAVLRNDGGSWTQTHLLSPDGRLGASLVTAITDIDDDGDLDIYMPSDRAEDGRWPPSALYLNTQLVEESVIFANVASELGLDHAMSGRGFDAADLNQDGQLDYVLSDRAGLRCASSGGELYVDDCVASGLVVPEGHAQTETWFGWSVEIIDVDNNAVEDVMVSAGWPRAQGSGPYPRPVEPQPDGLWQGLSNGTFEDWSVATGFGDQAQHYGLAAADLDGDGYVEAVVNSMTGPVRLWRNRCGDGHWAEVDFEGLPGNRQGFGVRVELVAAGVQHTRELHTLRGMGQGPDRLHFGLGTADRIESLRVRWPDGSESEFGPLPVDRRLRVAHPDL